jgi:hypothetical protein
MLCIVPYTPRIHYLRSGRIVGDGPVAPYWSRAGSRMKIPMRIVCTFGFLVKSACLVALFGVIVGALLLG